MMVKVTGSEWKRFYGDKETWPEGSWHEDEEITVDGEVPDDDFDLSEIPDSSMLRVSGGTVHLTDQAREGPSLEAHFKKWRKQQNTTVLVVGVPTECLEAVRSAIAAAGGKIRR